MVIRVGSSKVVVIFLVCVMYSYGRVKRTDG